MSDELDLVTLARFSFIPEAECVKLLLEEEGIVAVLADGEWGQLYSLRYGRLQVPRHSIDRATQVLKEIFAKQHQRKINPTSWEAEMCLECGEALDGKSTVCPQCGWSFLSAVEGQPSPDEEQIEL